MGSDLLRLGGIDPEDPLVKANLEDARQVERLIDSLVALRQRLGLTQTELADRMGTTQSAVSKFERAGGDPRLSSVQRYARAVDARLRCLVDASPRVSADWTAAQAMALRVDARTEEDEGVFALPVRLVA